MMLQSKEKHFSDRHTAVTALNRHQGHAAAGSTSTAIHAGRPHAPDEPPDTLYVPAGHAVPDDDVAATASQKRPATGEHVPLHVDVVEPPVPYFP